MTDLDETLPHGDHPRPAQRRVVGGGGGDLGGRDEGPLLPARAIRLRRFHGGGRQAGRGSWSARGGSPRAVRGGPSWPPRAGKRLGQALVEIGAVNDLDLGTWWRSSLHRIAVSPFAGPGDGTHRGTGRADPHRHRAGSHERLLRRAPGPIPIPPARAGARRPGRACSAPRTPVPHSTIAGFRVQSRETRARRPAGAQEDRRAAESAGPAPGPGARRYALFVGGLLEDAASETPAAGVTAVSPAPRPPPPPAAPVAAPVLWPCPIPPLLCPRPRGALLGRREGSRSLLEKGSACAP